MRVAVTGAGGFVGRALVPALRDRGHDVVPLERSTLGDIAEVRAWEPLIEGAAAVVHLAALAHGRGVDEARLRAVNVDAACALGRAAARTGARMIFMSSIKALGEETRAKPLSEADAPAPRDAYGRAKADAEAGLQGVPGLSLTILRPPLVYGPGVRANFRQLVAAIERGWPLPLASVDNRRSLLGAGNLSDAVIRCLEDARAAGRTYHVTDGDPRSTPALCRAIGEALGCPARLWPFPPALLEVLPPLRKLTRSLVADDHAIRAELGWRPPETLSQGLRRLHQSDPSG